MRIAFIDVTMTVSYGGIQTAVWQLACALTDMGHEVHVFGGEGDIRPELNGRVVHIHQFPFTPREKVLDLGSRFRRIWERGSFARHASAFVKSAGFDWIVITKPFDFFWTRILQESQTRIAFMSGGTDFYRGDRYLSRGISAWLACSHFNAWQIQHRYKRFPAVMYNGVDVALFSPQAKEKCTQMRTELGISDSTFVFGFAGRLVGWKGLSVAIQALADPVLRQKDVRLLLIGKGEDAPRLRGLAQKLQLENKIIFHPPVAHHLLPEFYSACNAGIFPSIGDEAFGITIAEAMSCELPVIASHIGGIPEVVGNEGTCGLLATPGDVVGFARAMANLVDNPDLCSRLGQSARQRIVTLYTWQYAAQRLLKQLNPA